MDDKNMKEMTQKEAEKDFRDSLADIFKNKVPGVHIDDEGFIVIPMGVLRRRDIRK